MKSEEAREQDPAQYWLYGRQVAAVSPAARTSGVLIRTIDGEVVFRVYRTPDDFIDYQVRHDEPSVADQREGTGGFVSDGGTQCAGSWSGGFGVGEGEG